MGVVVQQRMFGHNPFRLPFHLLSYCTCIALIKWNSIKTFVMQLLSLLGTIRLASPGNDCFHNHLFQECIPALNLCTEQDSHQRAGMHHACTIPPQDADGNAEHQAVLKTPVDTEILPFPCQQENGCLATAPLPTPHREEGGDHTFPALCLWWNAVSHKLELISLVSLELLCCYQAELSHESKA